MLISEPRIFRISFSGSPTRSCPRNEMLPECTWAVAASSRMIVSDVTDLPDPDSPTTPSVCPGSIWNETSSTALTTPRSMWKYVCRFWTSMTAVMVDQFPGSARRGSVASWIPSPIRLYARTVRKMPIPGKTNCHQ